MGGIILSKKEIRNQMKEQLSVLGKEQYQLYSTEIENLFFRDSIVQNSSVIGLTISTFPGSTYEGDHTKALGYGEICCSAQM